ESPNTGASQHWRLGLRERLLCPRVLALCHGPAVCREAGADCNRIPADAGSGFVQPRGSKEKGRGDDEEPSGSVGMSELRNLPKEKRNKTSVSFAPSVKTKGPRLATPGLFPIKVGTQPQGLRRLHGPPAGALRAGCAKEAPPISAASCCKAAMRFSVHGWVATRLSMRAPESGLTMNRCAAAGFCSAGIF